MNSLQSFNAESFAVLNYSQNLAPKDRFRGVERQLENGGASVRDREMVVSGTGQDTDLEADGAHANKRHTITAGDEEQKLLALLVRHLSKDLPEPRHQDVLLSQDAAVGGVGLQQVPVILFAPCEGKIKR